MTHRLTAPTQSSDSTDIFVERVTGHLFNHLPDYRHPFLTEYDFCRFELFSRLSEKASQMKAVMWFFIIIVHIQAFAVFLLPPLVESITATYFSTQENDFLAQILYFSLNLRQFHGSVMASEAHYSTMILLGIAIIGLYLYGLYRMHKRCRIKNYEKWVLSFFLIYSPLYLTNVYFNFFSQILAELVFRMQAIHLPKLIVIGIIYYNIHSIVTLTQNSLFFSVFFLNGTLISSPGYIPILDNFSVIIIVFQILYKNLGYRMAATCVGITMLISGLQAVYHNITGFYAVKALVVDMAALSATMAWSGILSITDGFDADISQGVYATAVFWLFILNIFIAEKLCLMWRTKFIRILDNFDPDILEQMSWINFMRLYLTGLTEGYDMIIDGTLLNHGLKHYDNRFLINYLYMYGNLIHPSDPSVLTLRNRILVRGSMTLADKFLLFDMGKLSGLRKTTDPPERFKELIQRAQAAIEDYIGARETLAGELSGDYSYDYLLLSSLSITRQTLQNFISYLSFAFPFSGVIRNLKETFHHKILYEPVESSPVEMSNTVVLPCLSAFPRTQSKLANKLKPRQIFVNNINQKPPKPPNEFFHKKSSSSTLWSVFSLSILGLFILIFYAVIHMSTKFTSKQHSALSEVMSAFSYTNSNYSVAISSTAAVLVGSTDVNIKEKATKLISEFIECVNYTNYIVVNISQSYPEFKDNFMWIWGDNFSEPTMIPDLYLNTQFSNLLKRTASILINMFPAAGGDYNSNDELILMSMIQRSPNMLTRSISYIFDSFSSYTGDLLSSLHKDTYIFSIAFVVLLLIVSSIPLIYYSETKELLALFVHKGNEYSRSVISSLLAQNFRPLSRVLVQFYVGIFCMAAIVILSSALLCNVYLDVNKTYEGESASIRNDMETIAHAVSALLMGQISLYPDHSMINDTALLETIQNSAIYLSSGANFTAGVQHNRVSVTTSNYLLKILGIFDETSISATIPLLDDIRNMLAKELVPQLTSTTMTSLQVFDESVIKADVFHNHILVVYFILVCLSGILLIQSAVSLSNTVSTLYEILATTKNSQSIRPDLVHAMIDGSGQIAFFTNYKRSCVLDLFDRPCALLDADGTVSTCNRSWLTTFGLTIDRVIGRHAGYSSNEVYSVDVTNGKKLLILSELPFERELKQEIEDIESEIEVLKAQVIPRGFLDKKEGVYSIGFAVLTTIQVTPLLTRKGSGEIWVETMEYINGYIENCVRVIRGADLLYYSERETSVLIHGDDDHTFMVLDALTFAADILRFIIELGSSKAHFMVTITVSAGSNGVVIVTNSRAMRVEFDGDVFINQVPLRDISQPNSIVIDPTVEAILSNTGFSFMFDESGIFRADYDENLVSDTYSFSGQRSLFGQSEADYITLNASSTLS